MAMIFNWFAKACMLAVWVMGGINIFNPMPGVASIAFNAMLIFLLFIHLLQLWVIDMAVKSKNQKLSVIENISVVLMGTFALLDIKKKYLSEDHK
ncbi:DUF1145 domain-containing protein [Vibrio sp. SS-MA-C1-2]|uniref:DUF1145 domain-containing protein n=1 Tax=Vibrio sp. SS-MA-C1-2 TaxID=2908646 RepID=UPI001F26B79B|nr:DUF1145 domain-containing protein [Vibrio sp. SS-MA-C1-2]UJF19299.1 DUF1145 domain-containing protein [Vibrio sp. SS-MA-C1-2]